MESADLLIRKKKDTKSRFNFEKEVFSVINKKELKERKESAAFFHGIILKTNNSNLEATRMKADGN